MEAVKRGGDRQRLHETIRRCSMEASAGMKEGKSCDLLDRLATQKDFDLSRADMEKILDPALYTGRCADQVSAYLEKIRPLLSGVSAGPAEINV